MLPFAILPFGIPAYIGTVKGIKENREHYIKIVSKWKLTYDKYVELMKGIKQKESEEALKKKEQNWQLSYEEYTGLLNELEQLKKEKQGIDNVQSTNEDFE